VVTPFNVSLPDSLLITDVSGNQYTGGSYGVGWFPGGTDFNQSAATLLTTFDQNGSTAGFSASVPGAIAAFGGPTIQDAATSTDGSDAFSGQPIYVVVGNAADLASSTDFIVFQSPDGVNWPVEVAGAGATASFALMDSTLLRGIPTTTQNATPPALADQLNGDPGVTFGVIPEPGAMALGLIGFLGLLRRRR